MRNQELRDRTKQFALRIVRMSCAVPKRMEAEVLERQSLRSGTSAAADFREAPRARSTTEFLAKLGNVEQQLDETPLWLELPVESGPVREPKMSALHQEAEELLQITVATINTTKRNRNRAKP